MSTSTAGTASATEAAGASPGTVDVDVDVVVVGAGMAGLYLLHRLRQFGLSAVALESADDVGGTWYWNRYPGARCDIQSIDYQYSFDPDLEADWTWSEKYATQPEILRYLQHVAERYDLRRDIRFQTRVDHATWDDDAEVWRIHTIPSGDGGAEHGIGGDVITARHYVMATGCLSVPKEPDIVGTERFEGEVYVTGRWPHEKVDFTGKRVAVIGTGSSAIQSIPLIAAEAAQVTVFQRTPNFSAPAHNGPVDPDRAATVAANRETYRHEARYSRVGVPMEIPLLGVQQMTDEQRQAEFEAGWAEGGLFGVTRRFTDVLFNAESNEIVCEFFRSKVREIVHDPDTAELLCPTTFPVSTKRLCVDTNYYETFNLAHVRLVDINAHPLRTVTETGIEFGQLDAAEHVQFDAIVYATGFDAMTGALVAVDIEGRDGITLKEKWAHGPLTYLGLMSVGFPNFFMITGPGSPSVLSNMAVSIEQHVEWVTDLIARMGKNGDRIVEPTQTAEDGWVQHVNDGADITLFPRANSWYMGANVPGKPRVFLPYVGGVDLYRRTCERVVAENDMGLRFDGDNGEHCTDGVINRLMPDVAAMLDMMAELNLPEMHTLPPAQAREFSEAMATQRPSGPEVGQIVDGVLPGPAGDLDYRLYRPATPGPHPIVCYFHGGGWVIGSHTSDDPLCRDLCHRSEAIVVSVDYRHGPEDRFPAAHDDAYAALGWVADHATELGGIPGKLVVAGWSAGANLAAAAALRGRDEHGPPLAGQLLITPVTDSDMNHPSYDENADGYVLTRPLMEYFWGHYTDADDRSDPRLAVLRAPSLAGLPPAAVFTCEFDPLRDEGNAFARALTAAGVEVSHHQCRGQLHTTLGAVDMIISSAEHRADMATDLQKFFTG